MVVTNACVNASMLTVTLSVDRRRENGPIQRTGSQPAESTARNRINEKQETWKKADEYCTRSQK